LDRSIRIGIGLKKTYDEANQKNVNLDSLFDKKQLLISLLIAIAVGAGAGSLRVLPTLEKTLLKKP
jgi:hypothetical protein